MPKTRKRQTNCRTQRNSALISRKYVNKRSTVGQENTFQVFWEWRGGFFYPSTLPVWGSRCSRLGAMYCPKCRLEYRPGFTRCSDCDVDLVYEPPESVRGGGSSGETGARAENLDDPFCSFWCGDDPRIHAELCELLNEEGIPHKTVRREDHLFNMNTKSAFEIGIPFSQFEKAEAAIKDAYGTEHEQADAGRLLPYGRGYPAELGAAFPWQPAQKGFVRAAIGRDEEPESVAAPLPEESDMDDPSENIPTDWDPSNWNLEDATCEVWSSEQFYPGEIIELALRENQIHSRFEKTEGRNVILVLPEDERRAHEVVNEIAEGALPE